MSSESKTTGKDDTGSNVIVETQGSGESDFMLSSFIKSLGSDMRIEKTPRDEIMEILLEFYSKPHAEDWLSKPQKLLGNVVPNVLIEVGKACDVLSVVNQLREGVYI